MSNSNPSENKGLTEHNAPPSLANTLFAASIHEIKNRFGLLLNQIDALLEDAHIATSQQQAVTHIRHDAQFIGSELVRVLTVFKAASGQMNASVDQQILEDVLEEVVARHATTAHATGCVIRFECDSDLTGFFDVGIITVVLDTCIYNAIKAGAKQLWLRADSADGYLQIHVDDNGPGFPEEMLRSGISAGRLNVDENSTGLGLYFANTLLSHHREGERSGNIVLGVSPEGGARVTLRVPE